MWKFIFLFSVVGLLFVCENSMEDIVVLNEKLDI